MKQHKPNKKYKKYQVKQKKYKKLCFLREAVQKQFRILKFKRPKWVHVKRYFYKKFVKKKYVPKYLKKRRKFRCFRRLYRYFSYFKFNWRRFLNNKNFLKSFFSPLFSLPSSMKYLSKKFVYKVWLKSRHKLFRKKLKRKTKFIKFYRSRISKRCKLFMTQGQYQTPYSVVRYPQHFRRMLQAKERFFRFYKLKMNLHSLKSFYRSSKSDLEFLARFEYRLDVFLWRLGIVEQVSYSQFFLSKGFIFVNGILVTKANFVLKKGDFLSISPLIKSYLKVFHRKKQTSLNPGAVESCYSTLEFFILENPDFYSLKNRAYNFWTYLDIPCLTNYLHQL